MSLLNSLILLLQMFNADIPLNTFCIYNNTLIKGQGRRQATKPHACFWTIKRTQVTQKVLTQS